MNLNDFNFNTLRLHAFYTRISDYTKNDVYTNIIRQELSNLNGLIKLS